MKRVLAALCLLPFLQSGSVAQNAADPAAGKTLWEGPATQCRNCHGKDGEGAFGPDLAGRGLSASEFRQAVRKPWGVMPTFIDTQVSDQDLADMAAYFASLPKVSEPGPWRVPLAADASQGQRILMSGGCAQCHGATFDIPRSTLGGRDGDFELFKSLVYDHTTAMPKLEPAEANRPNARLHMGNFNSLRMSETQLKEIYDWAKNDIGFRPALQARLTAEGATYTLNLANMGLKGKGLAAQGVTIDMMVPAGSTVVSATGDGYKGIHPDPATNTQVAEWQVAKLAPTDTRLFKVTLSAAGQPKGSIRWASPKPKTGPNLDSVNFALRPAGP